MYINNVSTVRTYQYRSPNLLDSEVRLSLTRVKDRPHEGGGI